MRLSLWKMITAACLMLLVSCGKGYYDMSPKQFESFITTCGKVYVIDVRTQEEYMSGHIEGAINIPVGDSMAFWESIDSLRSKRLFAVYCRSGVRSTKASGMLSEAGYTVYNLKEGILSWQQAGLPVVIPDDKQTQDTH